MKTKPTVIGCKEELDFKGKLEFGDVVISYPTMMEYAKNGVDTIYAYAKGQMSKPMNIRY